MRPARAQLGGEPEVPAGGAGGRAKACGGDNHRKRKLWTGRWRQRGWRRGNCVDANKGSSAPSWTQGRVHSTSSKARANASAVQPASAHDRASIAAVYTTGSLSA